MDGSMFYFLTRCYLLKHAYKLMYVCNGKRPKDLIGLEFQLLSLDL